MVTINNITKTFNGPSQGPGYQAGQVAEQDVVNLDLNQVLTDLQSIVTEFNKAVPILNNDTVQNATSVLQTINQDIANLFGRVGDGNGTTGTLENLINQNTLMVQQNSGRLTQLENQNQHWFTRYALQTESSDYDSQNNIYRITTTWASKLANMKYETRQLTNYNPSTMKYDSYILTRYNENQSVMQGFPITLSIAYDQNGNIIMF